MSPTGKSINYTVIGVVENFHFESLKDRIAPLLMYIRKSDQYISFRIKAEDVAGTINIAREKWQTFAPGQPFEYSFLDQRFQKIYQQEQKLGKLLAVFASLAILIGCLGLFGLASFMAEQRTKEIGIRKVMGASLNSIVLLLSKEFALLVVVANIIAWPVAYLVMNSWLQNFAYPVKLSPGIFVLSAAAALIIALFTISFQAIKAALTNPVDALKYE